MLGRRQTLLLQAFRLRLLNLSAPTSEVHLLLLGQVLLLVHECELGLALRREHAHLLVLRLHR